MHFRRYAIYGPKQPETSDRVPVAFVSVTLILLLVLTSLFGCLPEIKTPEPLPTNSTSDSNTPAITIGSYTSDIFYDAGYEITMDGVRFPLPTTLNELGPDWRFEDDERKYFDFEDYYYARTDRVFKHTITLLYYKDRLMAMVSIKDFDKNDKRNGEIVFIYYGQDNKNKGYADMAVNGVSIGVEMSQLDELFQGRGIRTTKEKAAFYDITLGEYQISYSSYDLPTNSPGEVFGYASGFNMGISYSSKPYGSNIPD